MPVQTQIQQRRGTAASWTSTNPTLAAGEIGFETDTNRFKIGTGSTAWASLNYWVQDPVTTKGDLYTFSTTDTRLGVGSNGQVLTADSATATGLTWATPTSGMSNPMTTTGDTIYSSSGSTPARLGIGSTGQVLTVAGGIPSWATPSGASANFQLLGSASLAGSSTVTFSGISGKNQLYILVLDASTTSAGADIKLRLNTDTGANYGSMGIAHVVGSGSTAVATTSGDSGYLFVVQGGASNFFAGSILVSGTNASGRKPISSTSWANGSGAYAIAGSGYYTGTSAISSISINTNLGTFDEGGTVYVYGA